MEWQRVNHDLFSLCQLVLLLLLGYRCQPLLFQSLNRTGQFTPTNTAGTIFTLSQTAARLGNFKLRFGWICSMNLMLFGLWEAAQWKTQQQHLFPRILTQFLMIITHRITWTAKKIILAVIITLILRSERPCSFKIQIKMKKKKKTTANVHFGNLV